MLLFQIRQMDSTAVKPDFKAELPKTDVNLVERLHNLSSKVLDRYGASESGNPAYRRAIKYNNIFINDKNSKTSQKNLLNGLAVFISDKANELIKSVKGPDLPIEISVQYTRLVERAAQMKDTLDKKGPIAVEQVEKLNNAVESFEQAKKK